MNTLESPLEALALDYFSYGLLTAVNSIWAWVAVITAAISFWRIRGLSPAEQPRGGSPRDAASCTSTSSSVVLDVAETTQFYATAEKLSCPDRKVSIEAKSVTGHCTKAKFSKDVSVEAKSVAIGHCKKAKFSKDVSVEAKSVSTGHCTKAKFTLYYDQDYKDGNYNRLRDDDWERVIALRMGDMGWYRWQDKAVFDGSVVRLWDGCRGRRAAEELVGGGVRWW